MAPPGAVKSRDWKQYSYSAEQVTYSFQSCYCIHFLCWYLVELVRYPVYLSERKSSKMQDFFLLKIFSLYLSFLVLVIKLFMIIGKVKDKYYNFVLFISGSWLHLQVIYYLQEIGA